VRVPAIQARYLLHAEAGSSRSRKILLDPRPTSVVKRAGPVWLMHAWTTYANYTLVIPARQEVWEKEFLVQAQIPCG